MTIWVTAQAEPWQTPLAAVPLLGVLVGCVVARRQVPLAVLLLPAALAGGVRAWAAASIAGPAAQAIAAAPFGLGSAIEDVVDLRIAAVDVLASASIAVAMLAICLGYAWRGPARPITASADRRLAVGLTALLVVTSAVGTAVTGATVAWSVAGILALLGARASDSQVAWVPGALVAVCTGWALTGLASIDLIDPDLLATGEVPWWLAADRYAVAVAVVGVGLVPGVLKLLDPADPQRDTLFGDRSVREVIPLVLLAVAWLVAVAFSGQARGAMRRASWSHFDDDRVWIDAVEDVLPTIDLDEADRAVVDVVAVAGDVTADERALAPALHPEDADPLEAIAVHVAAVASSLLGPGVDGDVTVAVWTDGTRRWSELVPTLAELARSRARQARIMGVSTWGTFASVPLRLVGDTDPALATTPPLVDAPRLRDPPRLNPAPPDAVLRLGGLTWHLEAAGRTSTGDTDPVAALIREVGGGRVRLVPDADVDVQHVVDLLVGVQKAREDGRDLRVEVAPERGATSGANTARTR